MMLFFFTDAFTCKCVSDKTNKKKKNKSFFVKKILPAFLTYLRDYASMNARASLRKDGILIKDDA